jgi:hypothetical protein
MDQQASPLLLGPPPAYDCSQLGALAAQMAPPREIKRIAQCPFGELTQFQDTEKEEYSERLDSSHLKRAKQEV